MKLSIKLLFDFNFLRSSQTMLWYALWQIKPVLVTYKNGEKNSEERSVLENSNTWIVLRLTIV